jgi:hypothetical protein
LPFLNYAVHLCAQNLELVTVSLVLSCKSSDLVLAFYVLFGLLESSDYKLATLHVLCLVLFQRKLNCFCFQCYLFRLS